MGIHEKYSLELRDRHEGNVTALGESVKDEIHAALRKALSLQNVRGSAWKEIRKDFEKPNESTYVNEMRARMVSRLQKVLVAQKKKMDLGQSDVSSETIDTLFEIWRDAWESDERLEKAAPNLDFETAVLTALQRVEAEENVKLDDIQRMVRSNDTTYFGNEERHSPAVIDEALLESENEGQKAVLSFFAIAAQKIWENLSLEDKIDAGKFLDGLAERVIGKLSNESRSLLEELIYLLVERINQQWYSIRKIRSDLRFRTVRDVIQQCIDLRELLHQHGIECKELESCVDLVEENTFREIEILRSLKNLRLSFAWKNCRSSEDFLSFFAEAQIEEGIWRNIHKMRSLKVQMPGSHLYSLDLSWIYTAVKEDPRFQTYANFLAFVDNKPPVDILNDDFSRRAIEMEAARMGLSTAELLEPNLFYERMKNSDVLKAVFKYSQKTA